jgi:hypothetical protein
VSTLIARHCCAREVIIAAQGAIERLKADLSEEESGSESGGVPLAVQLIRLLSLFAKSEYICLQLMQRVE